MEISKDEITLRTWNQDDSKRLAEFANNKLIADNLTDAFPYPYSINDASDYIKKSLDKDNENIMFAICYKKIVVGSIGLFFQKDIYRKSAIIAYFLDEKYWGKSITSTVIKVITDFAFKNYDINRISAEPFENNISSKKALEKAGYVLEGTLKNNIYKNGKIMNSCLYAKVRLTNGSS